MRKIPLYARVLVGVAIGVALGVAFGTSTAPLGEAGLLVVRLLKALAAPLIFLAVVDAIVRTQIPAKKGALLIAISLVNACVATGIGFAVSAVWRPEQGSLMETSTPPPPSSGGGSAEPVRATNAANPPPKEGGRGVGGSVEEQPTLDPLKNLASYIPENLVDPFRKNNVISIVFLAILFGAALRAVKSEQIASAVSSLMAAFAKLLAWIVEIVPFAVLGVVASVVGKSGASVFAQLGLFLVTVIAGLLLQAVVYYSFLLVVVARRSPIQFFAGALDSITTALSCGSSLATLPITLRVLNDNLKVSTSSARLAACVGTNLNHDGIILYEAAAAMFVARGFGYDVGPTQVITIALSSVMAGIGIAGVPEAGLITLPLVLSAAGLPAEVVGVVVPLILPVDWLIGRFRAATNVTSDMTVATILDRLAP